MSRLRGCDRRGRSGPEAHLNQLRGAAEPLDADARAPVHTADERVLEEVENHASALALYFVYYNFRRAHQTLRVTPAMEAGISDHVWRIADIVALLDRA
jgi:hypothetical protein